MPSQLPKRFGPLKSVKTSAKVFGTTQSDRARRAAREVGKDRRGWLRHGIAAMAIAGLGLAGAGAVAITGSANEADGSAPGVSTVSKAVAGNAIGSRDSDTTSRSTQRQDLTDDQQQVHQGTGEPMDGTVDMSARRDAQKNQKITDTTTGNGAATKAAQERAKALQADALKSEELSGKLSKDERARRMQEAEKAAAANQSQSGGQNTTTGTTGGAATTDDSTDTTSTDTTSTDSAPSDDSAASTSSSGSATTPVAKGAYSIAATFGQYGSWSRWHTGVDFAAPIGTPIHAPGDGTITNAGIGSASGWAGNYVVVKFANGDQMLMAHMSSVSVSNGQHVSTGQVIGHVGMTGRAFGPHTHVEFYPKGISPGDVYKAKDPVSNYFTPHGVKVS